MRRLPRVRRRWPRSARLAAACAVGVGLAWGTGALTRPWSFIDDDMTVALVSESCSISHEVVGSAGAFPEVRDVVLTVPIDVDATAADGDFRAAACEDVLVHVRDRAPWLHLAPSDWLCEQLVYDAARVHREHFVGVPAYVTAGRPLDSEALDERLGYHALARRRGLIVPVDRVDR